jgi:hypothetical protein
LFQGFLNGIILTDLNPCRQGVIKPSVFEKYACAIHAPAEMQKK